jgi:hypothetical protein
MEKTIKEIRKEEAKIKADEIKAKCEALAKETYGDDQLKKWSVENKGIFYLPILDEDGDIIKMAVLKPITRGILSIASTKIEDSGMYEFLEVVLRACWIAGDTEIMEEDEYFIPAVQKLQKLIEGYKADLVKR